MKTPLDMSENFRFFNKNIISQRFFLIAGVVFFLTGLLQTADNVAAVIDIALHDTYIVVSKFQFGNAIAVCLFLIYFFYWLIEKFGFQFRQKIVWLHVFLSLPLLILLFQVQISGGFFPNIQRSASNTGIFVCSVLFLFGLIVFLLHCVFLILKRGKK